MKKSKNINSAGNLNTIQVSLRTRIKLYKKRAHEIEESLSKRPEDWGKFQSEFNSEVNAFFRDIMNFEKAYLFNGHKEKVYKLKRLFVNRLRKLFKRGVYCDWSICKPFGYAGDFKIIDDIYQNNPSTSGFDRLFDNYYQMSSICVAVRNRKEDFKRLIVSFINQRKGSPLRIMNLGSGPCRELKEIFSSNSLVNKDAIFDCYDNEVKALEYSKALLNGFSRVNFIKENALKIAVTKDVTSVIKKRYDFIYTMGVVDYFNRRICVRIVRNLKKLLKRSGVLVISNVRDKYSNPSVHFMEWAGDWNLIYKSDEDFKRIFTESGFKEEELKTQYEQQGIMQYIIASNT